MAETKKREKKKVSLLSEKNLTWKKVFSKKNVALSLVYALTLTALVAFRPLTSLENLLEDALLQETMALDGEIVVIGVDEKTLDTLGPFTSWGRQGMAEVIRVLSQDPELAPAVIGVDFMFFGESADAEADAALVEATKQAGNLIYASSAKIEKVLVEGDDGALYFNPYAMTSFNAPYKALREVSDFAHVNAMPDEDGITRRAIHRLEMIEPFATQFGMEESRSFASEVLTKYNAYWGLENIQNPPLDRYGMWAIPFSSEPGGYADGYSFLDVMNGEIAPSSFAGKMVLIGPYAAGMQDTHKTPIAPTVMHGVEIHANIIDAMRGDLYRMKAPWVAQLLLLFVVLLVLFFAFRSLHMALSTLLMAGSIALYLGIARMLAVPPYFLWDTLVFRSGTARVRLELDPLYLPLTILVLFVGVVATNFFVEQRRRNALSNVFKKYLDPRVVERMNEEGFTMETLSSRRITASVMFVDIRGFTPFSEPLEPEEVVEMLGDYLTLTSGAVHKYEGFLDKFIGDATMAIFNAPLLQEDYAYKSVLAAWDIAYYGMLKIPAQIEQYGRSVSPGIGLNMGPLIFGNIGPESRKDLTAIGDTVNTAARFESVARPGQILMNETLYEALKDRIIVRYHGEMELKGKSVHPKTYALEQVLEYMGKYPPLASAAVPPGKGDLPVGYDFESAPRFMPEHLSEGERAAHLGAMREQISALQEQYKTLETPASATSVK